jgi:hypothetical protein
MVTSPLRAGYKGRSNYRPARNNCRTTGKELKNSLCSKRRLQSLIPVKLESLVELSVGLRAYDASVDLGRHLLWLCQVEVTLWRHDPSHSSCPLSLDDDEMNPARSEKVPFWAARVHIVNGLYVSRKGVSWARILVLTLASVSESWSTPPRWCPDWRHFDTK